MGTLITIWLAVMGLYYLCLAGMRLACKLPAVVTTIVTLPAMPFIVAYRNKSESPNQAKAICWLWGVLYAVVLITWIFS